MQFHLHGEDYASLHKFVPPSCLPQEYGGGLEAAETHSAVHLFSYEIDSSTSV